MLEREPSRTAMGAAAHRAAHQILEHGRIFADPFALRILGQDAAAVAQHAEAHPAKRGMRHFIAARAHFAETMLRDGIEQRDVRQVVVLGAGLDTFAYRNPFGSRIHVFEVDHPATQEWKRRRLREAEMEVPGNLSFVPVDFEQDDLFSVLDGSGFDRNVRTFFLWLGVVPYLTETAVRETLAAIGRLAGGAEIAFDYADPPATLTEEMRAAHKIRAARVAALGEPWLSYFDPQTLATMLQGLGFTRVDDLGPVALATRYWPGAERLAGERGGHVVFAATEYR